MRVGAEAEWVGCALWCGGEFGGARRREILTLGPEVKQAAGVTSPSSPLSKPNHPPPSHPTHN